MNSKVKILKNFVSVFAIFTIIYALVGCGSTKLTTPNLVYEKAERQDLPFNDDSLRCVCVYTEFTNTTASSVLPADEVSIKAYQHGIELSPWVFTGEKTNGYVPCDTSVQSGVTAKVIWIFEVQDDSEITIEFTSNTKLENVTVK